AEWLKKQGFEVEKIPVDKYGLVDPSQVEKRIKKETILVSVMHVNNEVGSIEPIQKIGKICREKNVYFHTDASQSFGKIPIDVKKMNIDLLTASSQKVYGPKGAALLFVREGVKIEPLLHGGGQESGMRSSTINIPAIVGFSKATEICLKEMEKEGERLTILRDKIINTILKEVPNSYLNGHPKKRISNNINMRFSFIEGESILFLLDSNGIAISTASACSSPKLEPSHVLLSMGLKHEEAHGSIRISLGRMTKDKDVDYLLKVLPEIINKLRKISPHKK
ncbi:MAG: cysteine desulfurase family protein, partial [Candidatus Pacebacteria bacterium]|nr:cysteine desulfurase family protein [Candidatus Paceibacterota bacterium]